MMATIFKSSILESAILHKTLTQTSSTILTQTSLVHSDSTWWWQSSWILPSWIQPFCSKRNSFILTQLDDGSHLELCHLGFRHCHLGFRHLVIFSQIHSKPLFTLFWFWLKLIQSDGKLIEFWPSWWFSPSWILPSWIQPCCTKLFKLVQICLKLTLTQLDNPWNLLSWIPAILHSKKFTCSFWLNLMMAAILNSAILDSDTAILDSNTLLSSLRFTQKHSQLHSDSDSN